MKKKNIGLIIFIVVVIGIFAVPWFIRRNKGSVKVEKVDTGVPVIVTTAKVKDAVKTMSFSSQVEGIEQAQIFPDIPGRFLKYAVENGQWVKKDQIIAYLEQDVPGVEREPIVVKSTIPGIISLRSVDKGQLIRQQDPMFPDPPLAEVARIDRIKVEFDVPEKFFIKEGLPMKVEIPSLSKTFEGKVEKASVFYNSSTRTQDVVGVLSNPEKEILPGMFAKVYVEVARENDAISLPIDAVIGLVDKYVFKAEKGIALLSPVSVGFTNGNSLIIREGVSAGDTVIIVGQNIVKDSVKVDIKEIR
jgi:multidrug efflux pump subunit AcrA (membrane-fusion protein)